MKLKHEKRYVVGALRFEFDLPFGLPILTAGVCLVCLFAMSHMIILYFVLFVDALF